MESPTNKKLKVMCEDPEDRYALFYLLRSPCHKNVGWWSHFGILVLGTRSQLIKKIQTDFPGDRNYGICKETDLVNVKYIWDLDVIEDKFIIPITVPN